MRNTYYSYRDELSMYAGLIFREERLVIPHALHYQTMKQLHSSHIGINGCLRRARECLLAKNERRNKGIHNLM